MARCARVVRVAQQERRRIGTAIVRAMPTAGIVSRLGSTGVQWRSVSFEVLQAGEETPGDEDL